MTQLERRTLAHVVFLDCVRERLRKAVESKGFDRPRTLVIDQAIEVELMNLEAERYSYEEIFQFPSERV